MPPSKAEALPTRTGPGVPTAHTETAMTCCASRNGVCLTVGRDFESTAVPDRFLFRLRGSRGLDAATADRRAFREFRDYVKFERYDGYQVESRTYSDAATQYEYVVRFSRA
jgi:hypothetical protein